MGRLSAVFAAVFLLAASNAKTLDELDELTVELARSDDSAAMGSMLGESMARHYGPSEAALRSQKAIADASWAASFKKSLSNDISKLKTNSAKAKKKEKKVESEAKKAAVAKKAADKKAAVDKKAEAKKIASEAKKAKKIAAKKAAQTKAAQVKKKSKIAKANKKRIAKAKKKAVPHWIAKAVGAVKHSQVHNEAKDNKMVLKTNTKKDVIGKRIAEDKAKLNRILKKGVTHKNKNTKISCAHASGACDPHVCLCNAASKNTRAAAKGKNNKALPSMGAFSHKQAARKNGKAKKGIAKNATKAPPAQTKKVTEAKKGQAKNFKAAKTGTPQLGEGVSIFDSILHSSQDVNSGDIISQGKKRKIATASALALEPTVKPLWD